MLFFSLICTVICGIFSSVLISVVKRFQLEYVSAYTISHTPVFKFHIVQVWFHVSNEQFKSSRFWIFVSFSIALQSKNTMNYHKDYKQIIYSMNPQAPKEEWGTFIFVVCDQSPYWAVWRRWLAWRKSRLKKICIRKIIMNVKFSVH